MLENQLWTFRRWRRERKLSALDNVPYNRDLWDSYAQAWNDPEFREGVRDVRELVAGHGTARTPGEAWATPADVERVLGEYLLPHVSQESVVGEIGSGGGRIAAQVAGEVAELHCFDISSRMLERAKTTLWAKSNVSFTLLEGAALPPEQTDHFDFLYSFDVFPHLDLHTMWKYVREMRRTLKPGGKALVHTANLRAPGGWERFSAQDEYSIEGHYFITPEVFRTLLGHAELKAVAESKPDPENFYLNRDYVVVFERPEARRSQRTRSTRGTRRQSATASKSTGSKPAASKAAASRRTGTKRRAPEPAVPEPSTPEPTVSEPMAAEPVPSADGAAEPPAPDPTAIAVPEPAASEAVAREAPTDSEAVAAEAPADSEAVAPEAAADSEAVAPEAPPAEPTATEGVVSERPTSRPGAGEQEHARSTSGASETPAPPEGAPPDR
jgi:SAM-dependent methyltransferase